MTNPAYDERYFDAQLSKSDAKIERQYSQLLDFAGLRRIETRVLDVGCGAGPALRYLANRGVAPFGTDLVWYPLLKAKELVPSARLVQCDLEQALPLRSESFDLVLLSEVIEHVGEPLAAMREILRVLRREGAVALTTPNLWDIRRIYLPLVGKVWSGDSDPTHRHLFNPRTLRALLHQAGFRDVRIRSGIKPWFYFSSRRFQTQLSILYPPHLGNGLMAVGYK